MEWCLINYAEGHFTFTLYSASFAGTFNDSGEITQLHPQPRLLSIHPSINGFTAVVGVGRFFS
jgi:hypothetical protein